MPRWEPHAPARLQEAALELYAEQGFEDTTAAQIAERAGLTRRTFFRHFPDKREVLFWGSDVLREWWQSAIETAEPGTATFDLIRDALHAVAARFEERRPAVLVRQQVLDATPELQERERTKLALLVVAITEALRARTLDADAARVAAEVAVTIEHVAFTRWVQPSNQRAMRHHIDAVISELQDLVAPSPAEES